MIMCNQSACMPLHCVHIMQLNLQFSTYAVGCHIDKRSAIDLSTMIPPSPPRLLIRTNMRVMIVMVQWVNQKFAFGITYTYAFDIFPVNRMFVPNILSLIRQHIPSSDLVTEKRHFFHMRKLSERIIEFSSVFSL